MHHHPGCQWTLTFLFKIRRDDLANQCFMKVRFFFRKTASQEATTKRSHWQPGGYEGFIVR